MDWILELVATPVSDVDVAKEGSGGRFVFFDDPGGNGWAVQQIA